MMIAQKLSVCIATNKIEESRDFYAKYFGAKVTFDCDWYLDMQIGIETSAIQFISSKQTRTTPCQPEGITINMMVEDVDAEYERLVKAGIEIKSRIENHPWGDRSFSVADPNGITICVYSDREPSPEFKSCFK